MSERPRPHHAYGCLIWGSLLLVALILLLFLAYYWWMRDTSDLDRAAAHARAQGLVTDPDRYYPALASDERIAAWERVVRLVEDDPVLAEADWPEEPADWDAEQLGEWEVDLPALGKPVAASWQWWITEHVGYERYDALIDAILAIEPGPLHRSIEMSEFSEWIAESQRIVQALVPLSFAVGSEHRNRRLNEALARIIGLGAHGTLAIDLLVQISQQSYSLQGFQCNGVSEQEVAILEHWLAGQQAAAQTALNGEWLWQYSHFQRLPELKTEDYIGDMWRAPSLYEQLAWRASVRAHRAASLARLVELHQVLTWTPSRALRRAEEMDSLVSRHAQGWLSWWYLGERMLSLAYTGMVRSYHQHRLHMQLVLAQHRQQPWPEDPYLPGAPLQPIHNAAGAVVGAYSLGADGSDDGWQGEDWVFWLTEELDP